MDITRLLQQLPFTQRTDEKLIPVLEQMASFLTLSKGEILVNQFDQGEHLFFLMEGELAISIKMRETEKDHNVGYVNEVYTPIGWSAFRYPSRYATTFTATEDCRLLRFPIVELQKLIASDPVFGNHFLHDIYLACLPVLEAVQNQTRPFFSNESLAFEETRPLNKKIAVPGCAEKAQETLKRATFFESFSPDEIGMFANKASLLQVGQGDIISQQDQEADGLYLLLQGKVVVSYQTDNGEIITTRTISRHGTVLSWCTVEANIRNRASIIASRDSTILYFSKEDIMSLLEKNSALSIKYWYRLIWLIGTHLLAARMRYLSQTINNEVLAVSNVVDQNAALLPVSSSLYKIGELLKSPVTTDEAFGLLYKNLHFGSGLERTIAGMCLDILKDVQRENGFYRQLQRAYDSITQLPESSPATDVRREGAQLFKQAFKQVPYVIRGWENLPKKAGSLFLYNHLACADSNQLPNGFHFPLDAQFISSMILDNQYGVTGLRVVRRSQKDEFWREHYYRRFGNLFVEGWDVLSQDPDLTQEFFVMAGQVLRSDTPLLIAPEGAMFSTETSPGPLRSAAFELAASMGSEEPWIVPIAVANFDKRVDHTVYSVVIKPAFKLSSRVDASDKGALSQFMSDYQKEFRHYVEEAIQLAKTVGENPSLSGQEGFRSNVRSLNQLEVEFESDVRALELRMAQSEHGDRPVVFYGSSSLRLWQDLAQQLDRNDLLNLSFGGATLAACVYYFERIVLPQNPRSLVIYAGDNDIGNRLNANKIVEHYIELLQKVDHYLPGIPVTMISIKPSPAREPFSTEILKANDMLKRLAVTRPNSQYLDLYTPLLGNDQKANPEYYQQDGLHLNEAGYRIWTESLTPFADFIFNG